MFCNSVFLAVPGRVPALRRRPKRQVEAGSQAKVGEPAMSCIWFLDWRFFPFARPAGPLPRLLPPGTYAAKRPLQPLSV
jgi:hypothetical protein